METEILTGPNCLANQNPRLGETVHGAEKGRHQNEALHVSNLRIGVADILQHESPVRTSATVLHHITHLPLIVNHTHTTIIMPFRRR